MQDSRRFEYMLYPRLLAIAETAWNGPLRKPYEDFVQRLLDGHCGTVRGIFAQRGGNFCPLFEGASL